MAKDDKEKVSFLDFITSMAGSAILLGGLLYVGGWSYLSRYYRAFGLEPSDFDVSEYHYLIYSLPVIFNTFWSAFNVITIIILASLIFSLKFVRAKLTTSFGIGLLFIMILLSGYGLSRYGAKLGNEKAAADMMAETSNLPNVAIEVTPTNSETDELYELDKLEFKLLGHAKERYFIFRPFTDKSIPGANVELLIVPENRVQKIRVQRGVK